MKAQSKAKPTAAPRFSVSIKGLDAHGLDVIATITANDPDELSFNLGVVYGAMPLTPAPKSGTPSPAGVKCPKCGGPAFDNRERRGPDDRRPLLKCQDAAKCGWLLWEHPKNAQETADAALWKG